MLEILKNIADLALRVMQVTRDTEKNAKDIEKANGRLYDQALCLNTLKERVEQMEKQEAREHEHLRDLIQQAVQQQAREHQQFAKDLENAIVNERNLQLQSENEQLRRRLLLAATSTGTAEIRVKIGHSDHRK